VEVRITENLMPGIISGLPRAVKAVFVAGGKVGADVAHQRVPKLSGALDDTIEASVDDAGNLTIKAGGYSVKYNVNVDYAEPVELGTHKMTAHPYMIPAHETASQYILDRLAQLDWRSLSGSR